MLPVDPGEPAGRVVAVDRLLSEQDHRAAPVEDLDQAGTGGVELAGVESFGDDDAVVAAKVGGGQVGEVDGPGQPLGVLGLVESPVMGG